MPGRPVLLAHLIGLSASLSVLIGVSLILAAVLSLVGAPFVFYIALGLLPLFAAASIVALLVMTLPIAAILWRIDKVEDPRWTIPALLLSSGIWFAATGHLLTGGDLWTSEDVLPVAAPLLATALLHGAVTGERLATLNRR